MKSSLLTQKFKIPPDLPKSGLAHNSEICDNTPNVDLTRLTSFSTPSTSPSSAFVRLRREVATLPLMLTSEVWTTLLNCELEYHPFKARKMNENRHPRRKMAEKIAITISIVESPELFIVCSTIVLSMNSQPSSSSDSVTVPEPSTSQYANNCST